VLVRNLTNGNSDESTLDRLDDALEFSVGRAATKENSETAVIERAITANDNCQSLATDNTLKKTNSAWCKSGLQKLEGM
jgi:hypothetical protein